MDPISSINIDGDSTFALGLEVQSRGHNLWYYTPDKLSFNEVRLPPAASHCSFLITAIRISKLAMLKPEH